ncbi:MAG: SMI1/KNR4 family protein [Promethearchaeota archaeon]
MEKLFELLFQHHPDFKGEIEGCSEEEIESLEKLVINAKIPEDYKVFLKYMGKITGRVFAVRRKYGTDEPEDSTRHMNQIIKIDYQSVLDYYKKIHKKKWLGVLSLAEDYGEKAENFFLFGIDCLGNDNGHFYLDLRSPDLPVVEISGTVEFRQHSPSFRAFLFEISFKRTLSTYEHSKQWL